MYTYVYIFVYIHNIDLHIFPAPPPPQQRLDPLDRGAGAPGGLEEAEGGPALVGRGLGPGALQKAGGGGRGRAVL